MVNKFRKKIEEYVPVFDHEWNRIKEGCEVIHVKSKDVLVKYTAISKDGFFLVSGSFKMSMISDSGEARTIWFFLDELFNIFATFDSLFSNEPTQYEIIALEDSTVVKFSRDAAESWKEEFPNIREFMNKGMMDDYMVTQDLRNHMMSKSTTDFISYLNKNFPAIIDRIPDKHIAQFMGITPEWFSKLQAKMKDLN